MTSQSRAPSRRPRSCSCPTSSGRPSTRSTRECGSGPLPEALWGPRASHAGRSSVARRLERPPPVPTGRCEEMTYEEIKDTYPEEAP